MDNLEMFNGSTNGLCDRSPCKISILLKSAFLTPYWFIQIKGNKRTDKLSDVTVKPKLCIILQQEK